jgi:hypothetical protein
MLFRKKKLCEQDPKMLSMEMLDTLHKALLAKLLIVTAEIQGRLEKLAELAEPVHGTEDTRASLLHEAKRFRGMALIFENVLGQQTGKIKVDNSN